jgi:hypothetical protein
MRLALRLAASTDDAVRFGKLQLGRRHREVGNVGKNNRQRRAQKRRERPRSRQAAHTDSAGWLDERDIAEILAFEAAEAAARGDEARLEAALGRLRALGPRGLAAVMAGCLFAGLRAAWEGGWQPADIVRAAAKRLGRSHADVAARMITAEGRMSAGPGIAVPEAWAVQLRQLEAGTGAAVEWADPEVLRVGAAILGMLTYLPVLPHLVPPPSRWGKHRRGWTPAPEGGARPEGVDTRMLAKVRALLAKAESTDFEEEAGALTAKAQELMARHAIDHAMVAGAAAGEVPCGRRIGVDDPYALGKANLLSAVAGANRCRTIWTESYGFSTVFGFPRDLDIVEVLYTSLLVQATRAMTAAGSVRDASGRSRTRSFRQSFLVSFSGRIGERLRAATTLATSQAEVLHGGALLPVLAGRNAVVEDAFAEAFPHLVKTSVRASNRAGWVAGRAAADLAHLGPEQQLLPGIAV